MSTPIRIDDWSSPAAAVASWWRALQAGDLSAIATATLLDHISAGSPEGRLIGREPSLASAEEFLATASIEHWSVADMHVREHGDVAVCSYAWSERGRAGGVNFSLRGLATDVLVARDGRWFYQAHHVGLTSDPAGTEEAR